MTVFVLFGFDAVDSGMASEIEVFATEEGALAHVHSLGVTPIDPDKPGDLHHTRDGIRFVASAEGFLLRHPVRLVGAWESDYDLILLVEVEVKP